MRIPLDACVAPMALELLADAGHDVHWVGAWPEDPGDDVVLERAAADGRALASDDAPVRPGVNCANSRDGRVSEEMA